MIGGFETQRLDQPNDQNLTLGTEQLRREPAYRAGDAVREISPCVAAPFGNMTTEADAPPSGSTREASVVAACRRAGSHGCPAAWREPRLLCHWRRLHAATTLGVLPRR